jgi:hypothetical protein
MGGDFYLRPWVFRFKQDGRERYMGLGPLNAVSLAEARQKATKARSQRIKGIYPGGQCCQTSRQGHWHTI